MHTWFIVLPNCCNTVFQFYYKMYLESIASIPSQSTTHMLSDEKLTGLYFVNDPSNEASTIPTNPFLTPPLAPGKGGKHPQLHTKKWGFNELLHRQMDLCSLVNIPCDGTIGTANSSSTLSLLKLINFIPFPLGAH